MSYTQEWEEPCENIKEAEGKVPYEMKALMRVDRDVEKKVQSKKTLGGRL